MITKRYQYSKIDCVHAITTCVTAGEAHFSDSE